VVYQNMIIGKPSNPIEAFSILKQLCGNKHQVLTGVAIFIMGTGYRKVFYESSYVTFKTYSDKTIKNYVNTKEPYDKAGGYAVQGTWGKYIGRIEGYTDNVIGLPLERILKELLLCGSVV